MQRAARHRSTDTGARAATTGRPMSDHDNLMSEMIRMKRILEEYVDEHEPPGAVPALELLSRAIILATKFPQVSGVFIPREILDGS